MCLQTYGYSFDWLLPKYATEDLFLDGNLSQFRTLRKPIFFLTLFQILRRKIKAFVSDQNDRNLPFL